MAGGPFLLFLLLIPAYCHSSVVRDESTRDTKQVGVNEDHSLLTKREDTPLYDTLYIPYASLRRLTNLRRSRRSSSTVKNSGKSHPFSSTDNHSSGPDRPRHSRGTSRYSKTGGQGTKKAYKRSNPTRHEQSDLNNQPTEDQLSRASSNGVVLPSFVSHSQNPGHSREDHPEAYQQQHSLPLLFRDNSNKNARSADDASFKNSKYYRSFSAQYMQDDPVVSTAQHVTPAGTYLMHPVPSPYSILSRSSGIAPTAVYGTENEEPRVPDIAGAHSEAVRVVTPTGSQAEPIVGEAKSSDIPQTMDGAPLSLTASSDVSGGKEREAIQSEAVSPATSEASGSIESIAEQVANAVMDSLDNLTAADARATAHSPVVLTKTIELPGNSFEQTKLEAQVVVDAGRITITALSTKSLLPKSGNEAGAKPVVDTPPAQISTADLPLDAIEPSQAVESASLPSQDSPVLPAPPSDVAIPPTAAETLTEPKEQVVSSPVTVQDLGATDIAESKSDSTSTAGISADPAALLTIPSTAELATSKDEAVEPSQTVGSPELMVTSADLPVIAPIESDSLVISLPPASDPVLVSTPSDPALPATEVSSTSVTPLDTPADPADSARVGHAVAVHSFSSAESFRESELGIVKTNKTSIVDRVEVTPQMVYTAHPYSVADSPASGILTSAVSPVADPFEVVQFVPPLTGTLTPPSPVRDVSTPAQEPQLVSSNAVDGNQRDVTVTVALREPLSEQPADVAGSTLSSPPVEQVSQLSPETMQGNMPVVTSDSGASPSSTPLADQSMPTSNQQTDTAVIGVDTSSFTSLPETTASKSEVEKVNVETQSAVDSAIPLDLPGKPLTSGQQTDVPSVSGAPTSTWLIDPPLAEEVPKITPISEPAGATPTLPIPVVAVSQEATPALSQAPVSDFKPADLYIPTGNPQADGVPQPGNTTTARPTVVTSGPVQSDDNESIVIESADPTADPSLSIVPVEESRFGSVGRPEMADQILGNPAAPVGLPSLSATDDSTSSDLTSSGERQSDASPSNELLPPLTTSDVPSDTPMMQPNEIAADENYSVAIESDSASTTTPLPSFDTAELSDDTKIDSEPLAPSTAADETVVPSDSVLEQSPKLEADDQISGSSTTVSPLGLTTEAPSVTQAPSTRRMVIGYTADYHAFFGRPYHRIPVGEQTPVVSHSTAHFHAPAKIYVGPYSSLNVLPVSSNGTRAAIDHFKLVHNTFDTK